MLNIVLVVISSVSFRNSVSYYCYYNNLLFNYYCYHYNLLLSVLLVLLLLCTPQCLSFLDTRSIFDFLVLLLGFTSGSGKYITNTLLMIIILIVSIYQISG